MAHFVTPRKPIGTSLDKITPLKTFETIYIFHIRFQLLHLPCYSFFATCLIAVHHICPVPAIFNKYPWTLQALWTFDYKAFFLPKFRKRLTSVWFLIQTGHFQMYLFDSALKALRKSICFILLASLSGKVFSLIEKYNVFSTCLLCTICNALVNALCMDNLKDDCISGL